MTYRLQNAWQGYDVLDVETGATLNFQFDWDYPALADAFGAHTVCECGATDGTVNCSHKTVGVMVMEASDYLGDHEGAEVDNYFDRYPGDMWQNAS